jgi:Flavin reductase like domain
MATTGLPPAVTETLAMLSSPMLLITTHAQGRSNGLVARSGVFASLVPEAPRVLIELTKANLTHDLVLASRVFALHTFSPTWSTVADSATEIRLHSTFFASTCPRNGSPSGLPAVNVRLTTPDGDEASNEEREPAGSPSLAAAAQRARSPLKLALSREGRRWR